MQQRNTDLLPEFDNPTAVTNPVGGYNNDKIEAAVFINLKGITTECNDSNYNLKKRNINSSIFNKFKHKR